jgi:hypothetical protein
MKKVMSLAFPPLVFCLIWAWGAFPPIGGTGAQVPQQPPAVVEGPSSWVAFSADIEVGFGSEPPLKGRIYRASNGSRRTDLYDAAGQVNMFSITNAPERSLYLYDLRNGWRVTAVEVRQVPATRLSQSLVGRPSKEKWDGLEVFEAINDGQVIVTAPAINFERVYSLVVRTGHSTTISNIKLEEPPADLFSPPPGEHPARVTRHEPTATAGAER